MLLNVDIIRGIVLSCAVLVYYPISCILSSFKYSHTKDMEEYFPVSLTCDAKWRLKLSRKFSNIYICRVIIQVVITFFKLNIVLPALSFKAKRLDIITKSEFS